MAARHCGAGKWRLRRDLASHARDEAIASVVGQRFDAAGAQVGQQFHVTDPRQSRTEPSVSGFAADKFVVGFAAPQGSQEDVQNIHARCYDMADALGAAFRLNTERRKFQSSPRIAPL
jgi:hypothetical protein